MEWVQWLQRVEAMVVGEAGGSDPPGRLDDRTKAWDAGMAEWETCEELSRGDAGCEMLVGGVLVGIEGGNGG